MCWNQPASAAFAVIGFGTAALLRARGRPPHRWSLFVFFGIMEVIQFLAYFVIDQCDHPLNRVLTILAVIHVAYQNYFVNWYFLCPEDGVPPAVTRLVLSMVLVASTMGILTKLPWLLWLGAPIDLLDEVSRILPEIKSLRLAGTPDACAHEAMCGPRTCTFSTPNHLAWSVPLLPPSYFIPSGYVHWFFFTVPGLLAGGARARLSLVAALLTGPLVTMTLAARYPSSYGNEWPATWCWLSVAQCCLALGFEMLVGASAASTAAGKGRKAATGSRTTRSRAKAQ